MSQKVFLRCIDNTGMSALTWAILNNNELVAEMIIETSGK